MESRLRKLELAGFSSALIGNVCPKQGFRKVTSTVSASSPRGAGLAARFSPAHLRLRSAGGFAEIPRAGNSVQENKRWAGKPAPSSLLVPFPGSRSASAVPWQRTRATRLLCLCPAASSCPAPRPQPHPHPKRGAGMATGEQIPMRPTAQSHIRQISRHQFEALLPNLPTSLQRVGGRAWSSPSLQPHIRAARQGQGIQRAFPRQRGFIVLPVTQQPVLACSLIQPEDKVPFNSCLTVTEELRALRTCKENLALAAR